MSIDLGASLRRLRTSRLTVRPSGDLVHWTDLPARAPSVLLLDATVYIDRASGRASQALRDFINRALVYHSSVVLGELAVGVASADPTRPRRPQLRDHYAELFAEIPLPRVVTPDDQTWVDAGVVAGTLARTQGYQPHQRKECLNDALIMLSAARLGIPVLTANRDDFDLIQQLVPQAMFVCY